MKKLFTLLCLGVSTGFFAQSFSVFLTAPNGSTTQPITNGGGYTNETSPNAGARDVKVLIRNTAAVTQTFSVTRKIINQSPALVLDNSQTTPNTYFCFGNTCFGRATSQPDPANYTILAAAGHTFDNQGITIADNSAASSEPFVIYFMEAANSGVYTVQYRIFNIDPAKANDTLSFKVYYNQTYTGLKSLTKAADVISDLFPNPAGSSKVFFNLSKDEDLKFQVYNNLGSLVFSSNKQKYSAGKNSLPLDDVELNNGLYFVTITGNTSVVTKRLLITK